MGKLGLKAGEHQELRRELRHWGLCPEADGGVGRSGRTGWNSLDGTHSLSSGKTRDVCDFLLLELGCHFSGDQKVLTFFGSNPLRK